MILLCEHPTSMLGATRSVRAGMRVNGQESAQSTLRLGVNSQGHPQAVLDANAPGYGMLVRSIQKSRMANLRAVATLATARPRHQTS
jgi:hypothetical protein